MQEVHGQETITEGMNSVPCWYHKYKYSVVVGGLTIFKVETSLDFALRLMMLPFVALVGFCSDRLVTESMLVSGLFSQ